MGLTGPQGPAGVGADGWVNSNAATVANISTTDVTLATVNLPAGSYLLIGKVNIVRTAGNGTSTCTVNNGATVLDQANNQGNSSGEISVLQGSLTLAVVGPTAVTLRCRSVNGSQATTSSASFRVLSAYKLSTLTVQ